MKKSFTMLCGALALVCLVSLFIPVIAPRYSANQYQPGSDGYTKDYILVGDYYCAKEYWSVAKFALSCGHRAILSVTAALLLYWATLSLMGEEAMLTGVLAATVNLGVTGYLLARQMEVAAGTRWGVFIVIVLDVVAAAAVAWMYFFSSKEKHYIKLNLPLSKNPK